MKIIKLLLTFVLLFSASIFAQSPANGGFENGVINAVTDWAGHGGTGTSTITTTNARTGVYSLNHTTTSNAAAPAQDNISATLISVPDTWYLHAIGWVRGVDASSRAQMRATIGTLTTSGAQSAIGALNGALLRLTASRVNGTGGALDGYCRTSSRSNTNGTTTTVYWDDVIAYTSPLAAVDIAKPTTATAFTTGATLATSVTFTWANGSDAATGIQNTIILRTAVGTPTTPVMNDQGVYSTTGGANGPNTVSTDWTVISTSVSSAATSFTDNTVVAGTTYQYAVIHTDLAYNYSAALVSGAVVCPPSLITSAQTGNWSATTTWVGGVVPASNTNVLIESGHIVTMDSASFNTRNAGTSTTVNGTLATGALAYNNNGTTTINGTFQIDTGGSVTGNSLSYGGSPSTLNYNNSSGYTVNDTDPSWATSSNPFNVNVLQGGLTISSVSSASRTVAGTFATAAGVTLTTTTLTLSGTCQINTGGSFANAPIYGSSSTLVYNQGGSASVGNEWTGTSATPTAGLGTPKNVTIQNSTTLNMPATNRSMAGDLNINIGNFTLNAAADLYIAGNWTRVSTATFTHNNRTVYFSSSITQTVTVSATGTETFFALTIQGTGNLKIATGTNISIIGFSGPNVGLGLSSSNATTTIDLNGQTLTLSGGGILGWSSGARKITSTIPGGSFTITTNQVTISAGGVSPTLTTDINTIVKLSQPFNPGSSITTINGTLQINSGGAIVTNSPIYGASSLLQYNATGNYNRNAEWTSDIATIGTTPGYPNNVQISNNTTLNYYRASNTGPKGMNGNLVIDAGSSLSYGAITTGGALSVKGNVTNAGNISLCSSGTLGDDLKVGGNYTNTGAGTFTGNNRAIWFVNFTSPIVPITQIVTSATALTIPFVVTSGGTAGTTVQLVSDVIISSSPTGANVISFGASGADVIDINGRNLTIGATNSIGTIGGTGTFKGSATSNLTILGSTASTIGTLSFTSGFQNLGTFTMNRQPSVVGCVLGTPLTVNTSLALTNGHIDLGANNLTLASGASIGGAPGSASFVIADDTGGQLTRTLSASGTYTYPIGDNSGTTEYTPATLTFTGGTYAGTVGVRVIDAIHPSNLGATNYLTRYWQVSASGVTPTDYTFAGTYASSGDITGTEANCFPARHDGTNWIDIGGSSIGSNTCTVSGTTFPSAANDFSAGSAYPEINIKGVVGTNPNILSGDITPSISDNTLFDATNVGSIQTKTFRIESLSALPLSVTSITLSNSTDFTVTASASYTISGGSFVDFTISFNPTSLGTLTSTVSIVSNDFTGGENPYTFTIQGNGTCAPTSNTITPTSGPVGTIVTVTAVSPYNLTGATATFNGVSATVASISSSQVTVVVPSGAVSGTLVTTNSLGCQASNAFTVINNLTTSCQGGPTVSDLFISEVTDATYGGLSYIEIYNGTGAPVNLSNYSLQFFANGSATSYSTQTLSGTLANLSTYVVSCSLSGFSCSVPGGDGTLANLQTSISGINFTSGGNDYIGLYKISTSSMIDSFGVFNNATWASSLGIGDRGVDFKRKNTATVPKFAFDSADWNITDWLGTGSASCSTNDYSDIGVYNFLAGTPPSVTVNPSFTPSCITTSMTVAGTEGSAGGNSLAYQWYVIAPNSNSWTAITDTGVYTGSTSATLNISDVSSLIGYQYYCQIRENSATCYSASNAVMITAVLSTTWQVGNTWSNGTPSTSTVAIINNNYDTSVSGSFEACSVTVNNGFTLDIKSGTYVSIINDLTVNSGGNLLVQNNGSLVMVNDSGVVTNNGNTQVYRTASGIRGFDYVYWSSPVFGQSIDNIYSSPSPGFKYRWDPLATNINSPTSSGNWQTASGAMLPATGYIVRGSSSFGMAATNITSVFTGKVNSGIVSPSITRGSYQGINYPGANSVTVTKFDDNWNLVGNPYPSSIKALDFLTFNTNIQGFVYLWTHGTAPVSTTNPFYDSFTYNYTANDYITYNGTATTSGPSGFNGYIASGQGFFVSMNDGITGTETVTFKNSMRNKTYNNSQFYRTMQSETADKNRIWLDLIDSNNVPVRTVVGYVAEATIGLDRMYDAFKNIAKEKNIYSLSEDETLIIQGRPTPFDQNDQVPIGVNILSAGDYKIAIAAVDGLFEQGQAIFLEDKVFNIIYDLRAAPYSFSTTAGKFDDRFVLRYTNTALGNPDFGNIENSVIVAGNQGELTIKSSIENIQEVTIYDVLGRQLFFTKEINNTNFVTSNISLSQQTLIVKIKLENGMTISRKIII